MIIVNKDDISSAVKQAKAMINRVYWLWKIVYVLQQNNQDCLFAQILEE